MAVEAVVVTVATGGERTFTGPTYTYEISEDNRLTVRNNEQVELVCSPTGWLTVSGKPRPDGEDRRGWIQ